MEELWKNANLRWIVGRSIFGMPLHANRLANDEWPTDPEDCQSVPKHHIMVVSIHEFL